MIFGKSITFDEDSLGGTAGAAGHDSVFISVENTFVERLRGGEAEAFDTLIQRYSGDIYALLYRITQNPDEASELAQETFLKAFKAIGKFRADAELKTWLFRIAINESRNRHRWWKRRFRETTFSLDAPIGDSDATLHDTLADSAEDPESSLLRKENERALEAALTHLPQAFREVIVLCDIEGQSYQQIAEVLGLNIGTVKSRIARGRDELRRKLKDL
ncbi:MAG: sigma-70 family RNA polymerase sigma factor [Acidobacteriota bacterium]